MRFHLVYAVPSLGPKVIRGVRRLKMLAQRLGVPISAIGDRAHVEMGHWPHSSPATNTMNLYQGLSAIAPTLLYHLQEEVRCDFREGDIFVGHPRFPVL